jgi:hypothetical protein
VKTARNGSVTDTADAAYANQVLLLTTIWRRP